MRRPLGPVAVVTPWNWPYTMPAEIVAPALAAGNTVVWTPAPSTAMCSALLAECVAEADLPPGVFNFVTGPGAVVGDELVANPGTVAVGFIGSTATGRRIAERAAGKRLLLEMGGNGPLVVLDGADIDAAAQAAVSACFLCAGQSCTAGERLLVAEGVRDEFVERLGSAVAADVRLGDPFAQETTMGPLNNEGVAAKMDEHVGDALTRGARVVAGGARSTDFPTELYWTATILDGVAEDAEVAREETFGPIAPVVPIRGLEHAIELANASPYGLLAAIFTGDVMDGLRFADEVRTGLVNINETTNYWENHLPFGGRAGTDSGIGRIGGRHAVEALDRGADDRDRLRSVVRGPSSAGACGTAPAACRPSGRTPQRTVGGTGPEPASTPCGSSPKCRRPKLSAASSGWTVLWVMSTVRSRCRRCHIAPPRMPAEPLVRIMRFTAS